MRATPAALVAVDALESRRLLSDVFPLRALTMTGRPAPGLGEGVVYSFERDAPRPVINESGEIAFLHHVRGPGVDGTNNYVLFAGPPGDLRVVARTGQRPPIEGRDLTYSNLAWLSTMGSAGPWTPPDPLLSNAGQVLYSAHFAGDITLPGGIQSDTAVFAGDPLSPRPLVIDGMPVPGGPEGSRFSEWPALMAMAGDDRVAMVETVRLPDNTYREALFTGTTQSVRPVLWAGERAPGLGQGTIVTSFLEPSPAINAHGQLALTLGLAANGVAVYAGTPDALRPVAQQGRVAAGMGGIAVYDNLASSNPVINDAGQIAFTASAVTPDGTAATKSVLYLGTAESVRPVARTGDAIPGTPWRIGWISDAVLASNGLLAFKAGIGTGPNGQAARALVMGRPGEWRVVAHQGQRAPGTPAGTYFTSFYPPTINSAGNMVFEAEVNVRTVEPLTIPERPLFGTDAAGRVRLIARSGYSLELEGQRWWAYGYQFRHAPGFPNSRTPQLIGTGGQDGRPHNLTESGQFIFNLTLMPPHLFNPRDNAIVVADLNGDVPARVVSRRLFYGGSTFYDGAPSPELRAARAVAGDKAALLPARSATFANVSSYTRGINGLLIDVAGLDADLTADDFRFQVGRVGDPSAWADAPAPRSITFRAGEGEISSDRVEIVWDDGAVKNTWLRVTLRANENTGLDADDVFYFGSLAGETGDGAALPGSAGAAAGSLAVTANDVLRLRRQRPGAVPITNPYDLDRSGTLSPSDQWAARMNLGRWLPLFTAPAGGASPEPAAATAATAPAERPASTSTQVWPAALEARRTRRAPGEPPAPLWA